MVRKQVLKFKYNNVLDLDNYPKNGCDEIQCGTDKFTLREFQVQVGHDDSLPYTAILCINGKKVCRCLNTGWGEETELTPLDALGKAIMASTGVKLKNFKWSYRGVAFELALPFIADTLAISEANKPRR